MKKIISVAFAIYLLLSSVFAFNAFASFDTTNARFADEARLCNSESAEEINALIAVNMEKYKVDFAILAADGLPGDASCIDYADQYYYEKNYGFGETKDGILLIHNVKTDIFYISYYGKANDRIPQARKDKLTKLYEDDTADDSIKTYYELFVNYLNNTAAELSKTKPDTMPYWYPDSVEGFIDFHGENLPLVVDDADVFSDEQEAVLNEKMKEVTQKHGIGYVIFTDIDNHGMTRAEYASDFLHFNGYGVGDGYGAVALYICFQEDDRGFETTSINAYEDEFTEYVGEQIYDTIIVDLKTAKYHEACLKHIDFVDRLFDGEIAKERDTSKDEANTRNALIYVFVPLAALIGGIMTYQKQKKKMFVISPTSASKYVVKGSCNLRRSEEHYLYTTRTRTRRGSDSDDGSGSSYSSGSSSGGSYSSSGGDF